MASKDEGSPAPYQPSAEVMKLWPDISGNAINGLREAEKQYGWGQILHCDIFQTL